MHPTAISLTSRPIDPFRGLLGAEQFAGFEKTVRWGSVVFDDRPIWCVNSTASGGGVAELLRTMLSYARGAGLEAHWAVIAGGAEFFAITTRIHSLIRFTGNGNTLPARAAG